MFPRLFDVPEVLEVQVIPSDEVRIVPEKPTTTKVLFPYEPPLSFSDVPEVLEVHVVPSEEVIIVPLSPIETNKLNTVNDVIVSELLTFPSESVTLIVQSEYVVLLKELRVIVLFPIVADVVLEEHEPPYVTVPASSEEKV